MSSFLQEHQRQPKLFIDLPSKGLYYDSSIIEGEQYMQIPVFGMNAMDEIMFKTPDALFSGEATAQVIRSCIPTILDPWKLVGFDIDYVLIAIRIATYSDELPITATCPSCSTETEVALSLTQMIENYAALEPSSMFTVDNFTFHLAPISYKQMNDFAVQSYTNERKLLQISSDSNFTDEQKNEMSKQIYFEANVLNVEVALSYVNKISKDGLEETNKEVIKDFVKQNDAQFYNKLKDSIMELSNRWKIPPANIECSNEECKNKYQTQIDMDYSNFFGLKFLHSRNLTS